MKFLKFFFLLLIAVLIFGSAGYFAYELFIKPSRAEQKEKALEAAAPAPTATPDPGIPEFKRLKALQDSGKLPEAREGWDLWITHYAQSPLLSEARQQLGTANFSLLFQPGSTNVVSYTVVKGDSLARIASKHKSSAELIQRANELPNINLQIGEQLVIPSLTISLELDRSAKTLTLLNNGTFLKEYPLLSAPTTGKASTAINSRIVEKIAMLNGKRIAFGDKSYPLTERTILLAQSPAIVAAPSATPSPASASTNAIASGAAPMPAQTQMPPGYVLSPSDLLEIFPLVSRNTPVVIH